MSVEFKLGNITCHYVLTDKEKILLGLTDIVEVNLNEKEMFSTMINALILTSIPEERTPPSENEIKKVESIANDLNLLLPENYKQSAVVCRQFIHQYSDKHNKLMAVFNNIKGQLLK